MGTALDIRYRRLKPSGTGAGTDFATNNAKFWQSTRLLAG